MSQSNSNPLFDLEIDEEEDPECENENLVHAALLEKLLRRLVTLEPQQEITFRIYRLR